MLTLTTAGTPRQRGRQHGTQAGPLVRAVYERYSAMGALGADILPLLRRLEALFPEQVEEMEGIAEGAGLPKESVFQVNLQRLGAAPACSMAGIRDPHGHPWIAKTDDIAESELGSNVLKRATRAAGPSSLELSFAGTLWTSSGLNDRGLCLAMTGLEDGPGPGRGLPPMLLLAALVERCSSVGEATDFLARHDLDHGGVSLLLADAAGSLLLLEKNTRGQCTRTLGEGNAWLAHTNHCWLGPLADPPGFAETRLGRSSRTRMDRLGTLLAGLPRTREGMAALLHDHDPDGGLCQHGASGLHTDYGIVLSPSEAGAWIAAGPPCRVPFEFVPVPGQA